MDVDRPHCAESGCSMLFVMLRTNMSSTCQTISNTNPGGNTSLILAWVSALLRQVRGDGVLRMQCLRESGPDVGLEPCEDR